jgi:hypothetical protein
MRLVASAVVVAVSSMGLPAGAQPALSPPGETPPITPEPTPSASRGPELDNGTITGQILLGGVLGLGGMLAGGYLTYSLACTSNDCSDGAIAAVLIGGYASASLGIAGGAYLVGNNEKAEGSFGAAFGGALVGGVAGFGAAAIVDKITGLGYDHEDARALLETTAVVGGWIGGSLVGYYMTRHWKTSALADVRPTLRADSHGMAFGIGASF